MEHLNKIARGLAPSATLAVKSRAGELRREGKSIIDLSAGEPDIDTPDHIKAAAQAALDSAAPPRSSIPTAPRGTARRAGASVAALTTGRRVFILELSVLPSGIPHRALTSLLGPC